MSLKIKDILVKDTNKLTARIEFRPGLTLNLRYMSRSTLQSLYRSCTIQKFNHESKQREPQLDGPRFAKEFTKLSVLGWEGFTPNRIASLFPVEFENIPADKMDEEIPFSIEDFSFLMENVFDLDQFVQDAVVDANYFRPHKEDEEKNSESSQSGS